MNELKKMYTVILLIGLLLASCSNQAREVNESENEAVDEVESVNNNNENNNEEINEDVDESEEKAVEIDLSKFDQTPKEWGEDVTGVKQRFVTDEQEIALTFDACGGDYGSDYDEQLITYLQEAEIPVTLFVNERWIEHNPEIFEKLAENPLFQIENHGTAHAPLSVDGKEAWGIAGTNSPEEVMGEIRQNHETVKELTGEEMKLFRSGTAFYDEVAVEIAEALDYTVVNFDILGDAGATYSSEQVKNALLEAENGSIALLHMNQPTSGTADGIEKAIPLLKEQGFDFVQLQDVQFE